ncbi:MAG: NTP transferase domain-containing protein [Bacteroidaceae bacterium]|nr:NTP transferase domain-containing protein [Bacteroidaceae bacterium]
MQAFLLAAGLGTRLKPLTDTMPKALVPVAGEPLLQHIAQKLIRSGAQRIVVNTHHFADQVVNYIKRHDWSAELLISDESEALLDTGGGLKHAQQLFSADAPIVIHNVDILSNADLPRLVQAHEAHDVTLLVSERKTQRYLLFNDDMRLVGWTNIQTGEVRSPYPDLDPAKCIQMAFSGIHVFSPRLFPMMQDHPEKFPIMDFYLTHCHEIAIYGVTQPELKLLDVGKCDTLVEAEKFLEQ